jgi:hypothetical protein
MVRKVNNGSDLTQTHEAQTEFLPTEAGVLKNY